MSTVEKLAERHEKLAREYELQETGFMYDTVRADGSHANPNCERARQSRILHEETAAWLRTVIAANFTK